MSIPSSSGSSTEFRECHGLEGCETCNRMVSGFRPISFKLGMLFS